MIGDHDEEKLPKRSHSNYRSTPGAIPKSNGRPEALAEPADLAMILAGLQTMRNGDFSVRLPSAWVGLSGKIADTFNESSPPTSRWRKS